MPKHGDLYDERTQRYMSYLLRLTEPAYFIVLATALFYAITSLYYHEYFQLLSIPFFSLDLPFTFYLSNSVSFVLAICILVTSSILFVPYGFGFINPVRKFLKNRLIMIITVLIMVTLMLFFPTLLSLTGFHTQQIEMAYYSLNFFLFLLIFTSWVYLVTETEYRYRREIKIGLLSMIVIAVIGCAISAIYSLAVFQAEGLIKGESGFEAKLDFKDNDTTLVNKTLIFAMHNNGNYYLIEKSDPLPERVKSYIIPEIQIKKIALIPCKKSILFFQL